jgi:hypothetical protein
VSEPLLFEPVDPEVMRVARKLALASKMWGLSPYKAIEAGHWDNGFTVRQFVPEAERQVARRRALKRAP